MRVLITGANGMLGSDLSRVLAEKHEVHGLGKEEMDVGDVQSVVRTTERLRPDLIIHAAALTDVDYCENQPSEAFQVNGLGALNVAVASHRVGAAMVYISTTAVFDGTKPSPYTEFDTPNPISAYAQTKYQGELFVRSMVSKHCIVRAGWMFGGGMEDKKFVAKILSAARDWSVLRVVDDKFGSPTYTLDLSRGIAALIESGLYGTYHMVHTGPVCSRYQLARRILEFAGISSCRLVPVSSDEFPLPAPRPAMEGAVNAHLELHGNGVMRPWPDALKDYIETLLPATNSELPDTSMHISWETPHDYHFS